MSQTDKSAMHGVGALFGLDGKQIDLLRVVRSRFGDEHVGVVLALVDLAPHAGEYTKRLTASAYRKGLLAGLSYDSMDEKYPECPYDSMALPNFMKGDNDPRQAWRAGSRDGLRIRELVLWPNRNHVPALRHREYKVLTPDLQRAHDERA